MDFMKKTAFCYHANCVDGAGALFAAKKFCSLQPVDSKWRNTAGFFALSYGTDLPDELKSYETIYLLDFSLKRKQILELREQGKKVIVIDHHVTAKEDLEGLDDVYFDMTKSGAVLTWEYLFPEVEVPIILQYVQDRDLWQHKLPFTKEINAYLFTLGRCTSPITYKEWLNTSFNLADFYRDETNPIVIAGKVLLKQDESYVQEVLKIQREVLFEGIKVPCVNAHYHSCSVILHKMAEAHSSNTAILWYQGADGTYKYSIRTIGDIDAAKLAAKFGGGGHKNAAGFYSKTIVHQDIS